MFAWEPRQFRLPIPATAVLRIEETLSDTPVSLPGLPPQNAGAYLVVFGDRRRPTVTFVLRLAASGRLAFYLLRGELAQADLQAQINAGHRFAESLGFILSNTGFDRLEPDEAETMWQSLPLRDGLVVPTAQLQEKLLTGRTSLKDRLGRFLISF